MARKNLLKGLMEGASQDGAKPPAPPASEPAAKTPAAPPAPGSPAAHSKRPRYAKGAIGAVSQSIADLKSRSISEIDPFAIDQGGLLDRIDDDDGDHTALMQSIREHGQQVPVLVRPHPETPGRYQIVYGRRRVRALRDLEQPVKAMIRDLDDRDLVIAQGQENSARKDLTFIEKANFARQMRDAGYDRKVICDALHVDKTQVSRMLSVVDAVSLDLIEAIGAAPSVGRDRWLGLAKLMAETDTPTDEAIGMANFVDAKTSDERFTGLVHALSLPMRRAKEAQHSPMARGVLRSQAGVEVGRLQRKNGKITVTIPEENAEGFDEWLIDNFDKIHRDWLKTRGNSKG
ncbi:MAG: plasmid partitioning protein RepB [Mangrovicoccus sp.]|nr:plasmid partitioning protein RepB [Mangrovicoccus sp.]